MARRCFFSFDYQDVADFRANVVRNHNAFKDDNGGFFDASIWEEARTKGDAALKKLIDSALENTTATAVLIGSGTHSRRWVQYEIMKSIERGNRLIGIHINGIRDRAGNSPPLGHDPFDHLALQISADGVIGTPIVWNGTDWVAYDDIGALTFTPRPESERGKAFKLLHWWKTYDWVTDDGYNNFESWIA
ncbi:TIR domain-containing protein [Hydrogenophaga sp. ANAO-22]|uniref:TIR domain-containing protein n=1 Tax=Hydrogenophaga sp. ANAO-22 TaxID=3166645 RepID=UPI0036D299FE